MRLSKSRTLKSLPNRCCFGALLFKDTRASGQHLADNEQVERTVMIRVAGMFCDHCQQQVLEALSSSFPGLLAVDKLPSHEDPIIIITYYPQQHVITIRSILTTIHAINDQLGAAIYHPPTIEDALLVCRARTSSPCLHVCGGGSIPTARQNVYHTVKSSSAPYHIRSSLSSAP
ncbi:hypothetical protein BGZ60DRAFT_403815 [Tricladium varicosporioides]|nr:hypothetical protein BGZ60DRAFT_403815 [Hymenoscyphus varicosporioides]